jgi:hypothetical protein
MARVTVTMADQRTAIMADQGTATMAATPLLTADTPLLTADTPQRTTAATLPYTTADIDLVTMLPRTMVLGTIGAGDRQARRLSPDNEKSQGCLRPFLHWLGSGYDKMRAGFKTVRF